MNLHDEMKKSIMLMEDRKSDIEYKEGKYKGEVTKVIAKLESYMGGAWTRLNKRYKTMQYQEDRLKDMLQRLGKRREALNLDITDRIQHDMFDPADEVLTRVVETKDATFTLAKATLRKTPSKTDYAGMMKAMPEELINRVEFLTDNMIPELTQAIELIVEAYTTEGSEREVKPALRGKLKPEAEAELKAKLHGEWTESINEDINGGFLSKLNQFLTRYDRKLDQVTQGLE